MRAFFQFQGVFKTRNLVIMALMAALTFILQQFTISLGEQFQLINISYLPGAVVGCLFGPWAALVFGFVSDTVAFIAKPTGPYFPGYALSAMVSFFIYACLLYRRQVTVLRVTVARVLHVAVVILGLNFLWASMLWGEAGGAFYTAQRLINNLVQLPIHVALTYMFCRLAKQLDRGVQPA